MTSQKAPTMDELLDRAREAQTRRDQAQQELHGLVRALHALSDVGLLDRSQKLRLSHLDAPRRRRRTTSPGDRDGA